MTDLFSIKASASQASTGAAQVGQHATNNKQQMTTVKFSKETLYPVKPNVLFYAPAGKMLICDKAFDEADLQIYGQYLDLMYAQDMLEVQVYRRDGRVSCDVFAKRGSLSAYAQAKNYAARLFMMFRADIVSIDIVANRG